MLMRYGTMTPVPNWFRCFKLPVLYAEHIYHANVATAQIAAAYWRCMLFMLCWTYAEGGIYDVEYGYIQPVVDKAIKLDE